MSAGSMSVAEEALTHKRQVWKCLFIGLPENTYLCLQGNPARGSTGRNKMEKRKRERLHDRRKWNMYQSSGAIDCMRL
jgi:hypothetical protein